MQTFEDLGTVAAGVPDAIVLAADQLPAADLLPAAAGDHVVFTQPLLDGDHMVFTQSVFRWRARGKARARKEIVAKGAVGVVEEIIFHSYRDYAAVRVGEESFNAPLHILTVTARADKASDEGSYGEAVDDQVGGSSASVLPAADLRPAADPQQVLTRALLQAALAVNASDGDSDEADDEAVLNQLDGGKDWNSSDYSDGGMSLMSSSPSKRRKTGAELWQVPNLEVSDDDLLENLLPAKDLTQ